jgi:hypothetical protein
MPGALSAPALAGVLVLYLAFDGGGYDLVVHSQVGIVVWWIVLIGAIWGVLPVTRPTRLAWGALALFGGFVAWTAIAATWSLSSERSLQDLSLVGCYLGIFVLALSSHRDRRHAIRHTVNAVAVAIVLVAALALATRLDPGLLSAAQQTASFLPGTQGRLAWPLDYWNALAALIALGLPLLLSIAGSARTLRAQAAAAAAVPILALCGYLTFSRGGAIAAAVAVLAFLALAPERIPKLATAAVAAAGSAALIAGAVHRSALENGLANAAARHEGGTLLIWIVVVCAGMALAQAGIGLAVRHGTPPRLLVISPARARVLLLAGAVACVIAGVAAGVPGRLSRDWQQFKDPAAAALGQNSLRRFGSVSGNGRYQYWNVSVSSTAGHALGGSGPGTFQLLWLPRATAYGGYVENAHSLYVETFAELGAVGLALLAGFIALLLLTAIIVVTRCRYEARTRAAGLGAALLAFTVSAASDWIWQVPVLPAALLLLGAAALAPGGRSWPDGAPQSHAPGLGVRAAAAALAVVSLVAIAVPLATTTAVRSSQAAAVSGDTGVALADARTAARLEPGAASPQLQLALVLELRGDCRDALAAARRAIADEPRNWSTWVVYSRLEAEAGDARASVAAWQRARSLNPRSAIFGS